MNKSHLIKSLDGLRGFAVLIVIVGHAGAIPESPIQVAAKSGVYIFFILSAFLLTKQFLDNPPKPSQLVEVLSRYYYRRFARILPIYYVAVAAHYAVTLVIPGRAMVIMDQEAFFSSLLLAQGYGHFWTIPIEFFFYFILPWIAFYLLAMKDKPVLAYGFPLVFILVSVIATQNGSGGLFQFIYVFVVGCLLALYQVRDCSRSGGFRAITSEVAGILSFFAFLIATPIFTSQSGMSYSDIENLIPFWTPCAAILLITVARKNSFLGRLFSGSIFVFWGKISFSAYLWHMFVIVILKRLTDLPALVTVLLVVAISAVVGEISFRFLEMPLYQSERLRDAWNFVFGRWSAVEDQNRL